jgi:hypothetical protein
MRKESSTFAHAKRTAKRIMATLDGDTYPYGDGPWEMHHGGSLWHFSAAQGWRLARSRFGIEWSMQFSADPEQVRQLAREAVNHLAAYPETDPELRKLGYGDDLDRLHSISEEGHQWTTDDTSFFTDCLFNSCVPLSRVRHTGVLPKGAGVHHYPVPIVDGALAARPDFNVFVELEPGVHVAVTPLDHRGSGDGRVRVVHALAGTSIHKALLQAHASGKALILGADHPVARQAFAAQADG